MAEKIIQTTVRDALGEFASDFAHFNDDVLFGENALSQAKVDENCVAILAGSFFL